MKYDPHLHEILNREAEVEERRNKRKLPETAQQEKAPPDQVKGIDDFWRIEGVSYRKGIYTVDLAKSLLDNGITKTQDQWINYSKEAKPKQGFYLADMPLYHSIFKALSQGTGKDREEAKAFVKEQMRAKYPMTLTRIRYSPQEEDEVIHNLGMDDEYIVKGKMVGPDEYIADSKDTRYLELILGAGNVPEINQVYQAINGTDAYIFRVNEKPKNIDERVVGFLAGTVKAVLYCDGDPQDSGSVVGVRVARGK